MCTLAIYFQMTDDYPVVIAANRDEYLDRPAAKPTALCERPHVVGGKDLRAGGTWLGVNEYGRGMRAAQSPHRGAAESRCALARAAMPRCTAHAAPRVRRQISRPVSARSDYNPFNLLIASREATFVAYNRIERIEVVQLSRDFIC